MKEGRDESRPGRQECLRHNRLLKGQGKMKPIAITEKQAADVIAFVRTLK
jgi:hypothetical protein